MITQRTNLRMNVHQWLMEIARTAKAENAEHTLEKIQEIASPILAMTAASEAADPVKMQGFLRQETFPERAERYIQRNAGLAVGLPPIGNDVSLAAKVGYEDSCRDYARAALVTLRGLRIEAGDITGKGLSDKIEATSATMPKTFPNAVEGPDSDLSTLLREVVGLPGDACICELITDPAVLANAGHALRQLGAEVAPEAFVALGVEDPDGLVPEDSPQP